MNTEQRFWSKVDIHGPDECWPWNACRHANGYGKFLYNYRRVCAHRIAWMLMYGDPGDLMVLHHCDTRACCNPKHLFVGTHTDNMADVVTKKRQAGERNGNAKLTAFQVSEIRRLHATYHLRQIELANQFGVHCETIGFILRRETWKE